MKKIFILILVFINELFAFNVNNPCLAKKTIDKSLFATFFTETTGNFTNEVDMKNAENNLRKLKSELYEKERKKVLTDDVDLTDPNQYDARVFKNCDLVVTSMKFLSKPTNNVINEKYGVYSYLVPNGEYKKGKIPFLAERYTKEEEQNYFMNLVLYTKKGSEYIYKDTKEILDGLITEINADEHLEKLLSKSNQNIANERMKDPSFLAETLISNIKSSEEIEKTKNEIVQNLDIIKDNISQNGDNLKKFFNGSVDVFSKSFSNAFRSVNQPIKRIPLKNVIEKINKENKTQLLKTIKPVPLYEQCKADIEAQQKSTFKIGLGLDIAKQMKNVREKLDAQFSNALDSVEDYLLYVTSSDFVITLFLNILIEETAKLKCTAHTITEEKNVPSNTKNIVGGLFVISGPAIEKMCKKQTSIKDEAVEKEETEGDKCSWSTNFSCNLKTHALGYLGTGPGKFKRKNDKKEIGCKEIAAIISENMYKACVIEHTDYLKRDIASYIKKINLTMFNQNETKDKCNKKSDILFNPSNLKIKDTQMKKMAIGALSDPNCTSCQDLRDNLESQSISIKAKAKKTHLLAEFSQLNSQEKEELKKVEKIKTITDKMFALKIYDFIGKLKEDNPNMKQNMLDALEVSKDLMEVVFVNPEHKARIYYTYFLKLFNGTSTYPAKTTAINEIKSKGLIIENNSLYDEILDLYSYVNTDLGDTKTSTTDKNVFKRDLISLLKKKMDFSERKIINRIKKDKTNIYRNKSFVFVPMDMRVLAQYNINTTYNLPITNIVFKTEKYLKDYLKETDFNIAHKTIDDEIKYTYGEGKLQIEKVIKNEVKKIEDYLKTSGAREISFQDKILSNIFKAFENKVLSMVLFETMYDYIKLSISLSNKVAEMNDREKLWFEMKLYKMYKMFE